MNRYQQNTAIDFIEMEDNQLVIFDPDSGDTHFIDETGRDILETLKDGATLEETVTSLTAIYDVSAEEIQPDVIEFLEEMLKKEVVLCHED